jgi:AcrR family transcriptional regulator
MDLRRRPGRPALISHADVVRTACAIADVSGISAVSMRAVGMELGVAPMGLYRHIADKEALLEAMVELVAAEYDLDTLPGTWRDALVQLARQQKAIIEHHPWLPELATRYHPLGPATLAYVERALQLFELAGTPRASLLETVGLFNGLVTALVVAGTTPTRGLDEARQRELGTLLSSGQYPIFVSLAGQPHLNLDQEFDRLVLRLIDGLA